MMTGMSNVLRLDRVATALEDMILAAGDREILAECAGGVDETRDFIAGRLAVVPRSPLPLPARRGQRVGVARRTLPVDAAGRRRLLGRLIATRPGIPANIRMAFGSREPEDAEIAEMLERLLRDDEGQAVE